MDKIEWGLLISSILNKWVDIPLCAMVMVNFISYYFTYTFGYYLAPMTNYLSESCNGYFFDCKLLRKPQIY